MRIVQNTRDRLVLEHYPWFMAGFTWLMGMAAFSTGVLGIKTEGAERLFLVVLGVGVMAMAAIFMPFVRIIFDRTQRMITRRRAHIDRARELRIPFERVARVRQEANWSDSSRLTRLVLEMTDGTLTPLETGFSSHHLDPIEAETQSWFEAATGA